MADSRGYVYEHRLIASEAAGRPLRRCEVVHHINGDKLDNRPENLEVIESVGAHMARHAVRDDLRQAGQPNPVVRCECGCDRTLTRFDDEGRPRRYISGHNTQRDRFGRFIAP